MRGGAVTGSNMPVCLLIYQNKIYHADSLSELIEWVGYPGRAGAVEPEPAPAPAPARAATVVEERVLHGPSGLRDY